VPYQWFQSQLPPFKIHVRKKAGGCGPAPNFFFIVVIHSNQKKRKEMDLAFIFFLNFKHPPKQVFTEKEKGEKN
jgi:hypothetical protein